jgi:hypothetical protein
MHFSKVFQNRIKITTAYFENGEIFKKDAKKSPERLESVSLIYRNNFAKASIFLNNPPIFSSSFKKDFEFWTFIFVHFSKRQENYDFSVMKRSTH